jgi:hypothetical protein
MAYNAAGNGIRPVNDNFSQLVDVIAAETTGYSEAVIDFTLATAGAEAGLCSIDGTRSGITSTNSINIRQINSGTIRTFYVDNISVTIAADYNYATDGDVDDAANFATNWPYTTGIGSGSTTRNGSDGFNASSSAGVTITAGAANAGLRNKLSINPLASTLYRVSVYAKSSNAFNDFKIRYSPNGGTNYVDCVDYNTQTLTTSSWTQVTCYMTTDATAVSNPYIYFVESTSSARTFYVDAFSMTLASLLD